MAILAFLQSLDQRIRESPLIGKLNGYDSLMDCIWNDAMVENLVQDMSDIVRRGEVSRAYEREPLMQELISASAQGVVILYGPPGSGKTALFEELSHRVVNKQIPTLRGWKILRLKLKQVKGDSSIEGKMGRLLDGGPKNRLHMLIKYVQKKHAQGNPCIILIDEIQDLLENNIAMFDEYKEELARSKIHIIGATTNKSVIDLLRTRGGSGAGMERRIGIIELQEMSQDETVKVITQLTEKPSKCSVDFRYAPDFAWAIVELAKSRYPLRIFPDCAVTFFEDVKRFYIDKNATRFLGGNATLSNTIVCVPLGSKEVVEYFAMISDKPKEVLNHRVKNRAEFADLFFPLMKSSPTDFHWIESEAYRLEIFFRDFSEDPFLFLQGESEAFLTQMITTYAQKKQIVCCDVAELIKHVHDAEGRKLMFQTLQRRLSESSSNILLILKNFNPKRVSAAKVATVASKAEEIVHKVENTPVGQILNQVSTTLGIGSVSSMVTKTSEAPIQLAQSIPLVEELLQFIEREKIPTVVTLTSETAAQRDRWSLFEVRSLTMDQTVQWFKGLFPDKQTQVLPILTAFYYLKDSSLPQSVIDLTLQVLIILGDDPAKAMLEVLRGFKSLKEIQSALEVANIAMNEEPWSELSGEEVLFQNVTFPDTPPGSVLWIAENSPHRRDWISLQMARQMKPLHCYWFQPSPAWRGMPPSLKEQLLHQFFQTDKLKSDQVLFVSESDLKDIALQKVLQKGAWRVVGFYSPKPSVSAQTLNPAMPQLIEQAKALLKDLMVSKEIPSIQPPVSELGLNSLYYTPPALTLQEKKEIFSYILGDVSEDAKFHILPLYMLLAEKTDSFDETLERLKQDVNILKEKPTDQIDVQFTEFYGKELKMSLEDIRYVIHPKFTSLGYRFYRFVKSGLASGLNLILAPFRWMASHLILAITPLIGGWILSKIMPRTK